MNMFSNCMQKELESYNIKVKCLTPGFVGTNMTKTLHSFVKRHPNVTKTFFPDAKFYVKSAIKSFFEDDIMATGYWGHTLMVSPEPSKFFILILNVVILCSLKTLKIDYFITYTAETLKYGILPCQSKEIDYEDILYIYTLIYI